MLITKTGRMSGLPRSLTSHYSSRAFHCETRMRLAHRESREHYIIILCERQNATEGLIFITHTLITKK